MRRVTQVMLMDVLEIVAYIGLPIAIFTGAMCLLTAIAVPLSYFADRPIPPLAWIGASIGWVLIIVGGVFAGTIWHDNAEKRAERQLRQEEWAERQLRRVERARRLKED